MKFSLNVSPWKKNAAIVAAAVTVVAGVVAGRERPSLEIIQEKVRPVAEDGIDLARLQRPEPTVPQNDPFARNFGQPKPAQVSNAAPVVQKPVAPPLPFRYSGRLTENGKTEVFVMRGEELIAVAAGQQIGDYKVEQVADTSISFTYLPMKMRQTLDLQ
jgi:Tfp pilus assembly protein PilP